MQRNGAVRKRGFTLIELLTVVAIIALLIGLLVPAVNTARVHAKNASVRALVETLGKGCEMFNQDFGVYPQSSGNNPFEASNVALSGAQWLVLDLAGADLKGYLKQDKDHFYNASGQPVLTATAADWLYAYDLPSGPDDWRNSARRWGPYVPLDGKIAKSPERYRDDSGVVLTAPFNLGSSDWKNSKLPFIVDAFNYPVLYYAANPHAKQPFVDPNVTLPSGLPVPGRYDQRDNTPFTGSDAGAIAGLDLGAGVVPGRPGEYHNLHRLGWSAVAASYNTRPGDGTFAAAVYDRGLFEQQGGGTGATGKVWPYRADTFLLISAGKDGQYGSSDDITNFERQ